MRHLISQVERIFFIKERGLSIEPGISSNYSRPVNVGDDLLLVRPDGSELRTTVAGIPLGLSKDNAGIPILLSISLRPEDVPLGTTVYHLTPLEK